MTYRVNDSFKPNGLDGFVSNNSSAYDPCPAYTIAQVARDRVVDKSLLDLPEGYDEEVLNTICWLSGKVGVEFNLSLRQGCELRDIGAQILALDNENRIMPPLDFEETQSIRRLVQVVNSTEVIVSQRQ